MEIAQKPKITFLDETIGFMDYFKKDEIRYWYHYRPLDESIDKELEALELKSLNRSGFPILKRVKWNIEVSDLSKLFDESIFWYGYKFQRSKNIANQISSPKKAQKRKTVKGFQFFKWR